jgi:hypothetical protein
MEYWKAVGKLVAIIGFIFGLLFVGLYLEKREDSKIWNDGIHRDCGGKWKVFAATHIRNAGTVYHYKCEKCENVFESQFNHNR